MMRADHQSRSSVPQLKIKLSNFNPFPLKELAENNASGLLKRAGGGIDEDWVAAQNKLPILNTKL